MLINDKTEPPVIITLHNKNILHKEVILKYYEKTYSSFISKHQTVFRIYVLITKKKERNKEQIRKKEEKEKRKEKIKKQANKYKVEKKVSTIIYLL